MATFTDDYPYVHPFKFREPGYYDWCVCGRTADFEGHRIYAGMHYVVPPQPIQIDIQPHCPACKAKEGHVQEFVTKDSGERQQFETGMVRDVQTDKPRYDLVDRPLLKRWAELMGRGAVKYGEENWRKAATEAEMKRFQASAFRHLMQWLEDDRTEDHAAAVVFNLAGAEMVRGKLGL